MFPLLFFFGRVSNLLQRGENSWAHTDIRTDRQTGTTGLFAGRERSMVSFLVEEEAELLLHAFYLSLRKSTLAHTHAHSLLWQQNLLS